MMLIRRYLVSVLDIWDAGDRMLKGFLGGSWVLSWGDGLSVSDPRCGTERDYGLVSR